MEAGVHGVLGVNVIPIRIINRKKDTGNVITLHQQMEVKTALGKEWKLNTVHHLQVYLIFFSPFFIIFLFIKTYYNYIQEKVKMLHEIHNIICATLSRSLSPSTSLSPCHCNTHNSFGNRWLLSWLMK